MEALLGPLFGGLAALLGGILTWAIRDKAKVQMTEAQERMLTGVINAAVGIAEEATRSGMKGAPKLDLATSYAAKEMARLKLPALPEVTLQNRIHAQLGLVRLTSSAPSGNPVPVNSVSGITKLPSTLLPSTPPHGTQRP